MKFSRLLILITVFLFIIIGGELVYLLSINRTTNQAPSSSNKISNKTASNISPTISFNKTGFDQHVSVLLNEASLALQWNVLNYMAVSKRNAVVNNVLEIEMRGSIVSINPVAGSLYDNQLLYKVKMDILGDEDSKPTPIYYTEKQLSSVKIVKNNHVIDFNQLKIGDRVTIIEKFNFKSEKLQESQITVL